MLSTHGYYTDLARAFLEYQLAVAFPLLTKVMVDQILPQRQIALIPLLLGGIVAVVSDLYDEPDAMRGYLTEHGVPDDRIVSDYGGEIQVTSERGQGTTVTVRLPAQTEATAVTGNRPPMDT